jgi:GT2 family glycosyltransferase
MTSATTTPSLTAAATASADVVAVVVHYRGADDTLACVQSLRAHAAGTPVVVVDNASPDGSVAALTAAFAGADDVVLLLAPANGGFGAGCNLGIDAALLRWPAAAHVLLLNPDAQLTAGALAALRATAMARGAGIVGCRIERPDGSAWFANGRLPRWTLSRFHCAPPAGVDEFAADFVTGCCMLVDAALLRQGLRFDPRFFLYGEDADLCCEVAARGRTLWITQRATVVHRGGGSQRGGPVLGEQTREQLYWQTRAKVLLAWKRLSWLQRAVFLFTAAVGKPLLGLLRWPHGRWCASYCRGLLAGLRAARRLTCRPT